MIDSYVSNRFARDCFDFFLHFNGHVIFFMALATKSLDVSEVAFVLNNSNHHQLCTFHSFNIYFQLPEKSR